jgi:choline transport protein
MTDVLDQETKGALQEKRDSLNGDGLQVDTGVGSTHEIINASGHRDQLDRQYGILSICGMALTVDNAWVAIGTSLNVSICEFPWLMRDGLLG